MISCQTHQLFGHQTETAETVGLVQGYSPTHALFANY